MQAQSWGRSREGAVVRLKRGTNVALTREVPDLATVVLGVSWDAGTDAALDSALVASTLLCDEDSHVLSGEHVVFFNQLVSPDLTVAQRESALGGDREQIEVDLPDVPERVHRVIVALHLGEALSSRRTLGQLKRCAVRVLDARGDVELAASEDLAPRLGPETALVLGELYRHRSGWKFRVIGQGYHDGLRGVADDYRVPV